MLRVRQYVPILLAALAWLAQVQGTIHSIGHLSDLPGWPADHATSPHGTVCHECAAFAQAGAAPVLALPAPIVLVSDPERIDAAQFSVDSALPFLAYRSRAPPSIPI